MTTRSEAAADRLERNIWIFHAVSFGYFILNGIMEVI